MAEGALSEKLSGLDAISQLADSDLVYVVTANGSRKMTGGDLRKELVRNGIHEAAVDPTADDDSDAGFYKWQYWHNTASGELFRCLDAASGAAVWVKTTLTLDELGSAATKNTGTGAGEVPTNADRNLDWFDITGDMTLDASHARKTGLIKADAVLSIDEYDNLPPGWNVELVRDGAAEHAVTVTAAGTGDQVRGGKTVLTGDGAILRTQVDGLFATIGEFGTP